MLVKSKQILMTANGNSYTVLPANGIIAITGSLFRFGVGVLVTFQSGVTGTATVLVSGDPTDTRSYGQGPTNWNNHDVLVNLTASKNSNLAYPVSALALSVSNFVSNSGGGIVLSVVQVTG